MYLTDVKTFYSIGYFNPNPCSDDDRTIKDRSAWCLKMTDSLKTHIMTGAEQSILKAGFWFMLSTTSLEKLFGERLLFLILVLKSYKRISFRQAILKRWRIFQGNLSPQLWAQSLRKVLVKQCNRIASVSRSICSNSWEDSKHFLVSLSEAARRLQERFHCKVLALY